LLIAGRLLRQEVRADPGLDLAPPIHSILGWESCWRSN
jgi:hypothetical protein